ncbi:hypothetical protein HPB48_004881 [Haemaphysalis longicornis]|uniref:Transposase Tc1-like domain-containing protein n=1 Tax=Haemaphysalis longicornis TaxID=44386 RepID=A0A9J6GF75_HAELO|nr:hypothetical protein HPB48_004881 [Haemaphysalis longicornis]
MCGMDAAVTLFLVIRSSLRLAVASPQSAFQCGGQNKGTQDSKRATHVPVEDRKLIRRRFVQGLPQRVICQRTGRSKTAVSRIIHAFLDDGKIADAKRPGRPRVTQHIDEELIVEAVVADPFLNASAIRDELFLEGSQSTVRRRLKELGLSNCVAAKKPFRGDNASSGLNSYRSTSIRPKKNGALSFFLTNTPLVLAGISSCWYGGP